MLYRIDTFVLPDAAHEPFERQSQKVLELLRGQPGFVSDQVFRKVAGSGSVNVVTIVAWKDQVSIEAAGAAVRQLHSELDFDPEAFSRDHGITESKAIYAAD